MIRTSLLMTFYLTVLTGIAYPLLMTGIGMLFFRDKAAGSLIVEDGRIVGSRLIGQEFSDPRYFWGRPSATTPFPYNAGSSSGSNYGPLNPDLKKAIEVRREALQRVDPDNQASIPIDLLTSSGSGLDPHISLASAEYQAPRIARLRSLDIAAVRSLITANIQTRQLGFLGEPVVNVLTLNRALDGKGDTYRSCDGSTGAIGRAPTTSTPLIQTSQAATRTGLSPG